MSRLDAAWRGGKWGALFGLVGGSGCGLLYLLEVTVIDGLPWLALIVRAYSLALLAGIGCGATVEVASGAPLGTPTRLVGIALTGAACGVFGAGAIATLPNTPFPGPVVGVVTLGTAALGFSFRAVSLATRRTWFFNVPPALLPPLLLAPFVGLALENGGILALDALRVEAQRLGLLELGALAGGAVGTAIATSVSVSVILASWLDRALTRRERAAGGARAESP